MDLPHSHTTSDLALRSALAVFSAHPKLPLLTTAYMALRHRKALEQGHTATADALARLAVCDATGAMVRELNRCIGKRYPTVLVELWRDPRTRRELRRLLREALKIHGKGITWQQMRACLQFMSDHERQHREMVMAYLLTDLAELATQPDERAVAGVAGRARTAAGEWQAAEVLRPVFRIRRPSIHSGRTSISATRKNSHASGARTRMN